MHIVVFSMMYAPDDFKINDIVLELIRQGHSVKVVTGLPDYATSHIPGEYRWFRKRHEKMVRYEVRRLPIIARRHGVLFRMLNYLSYPVPFTRCFVVKKAPTRFWFTKPRRFSKRFRH